jgi:hypothetical protein
VRLYGSVSVAGYRLGKGEGREPCATIATLALIHEHGLYVCTCLCICINVCLCVFAGDCASQTELGQLLDLITAPENAVDLSRFSMDKYKWIVKYKVQRQTV